MVGGEEHKSQIDRGCTHLYPDGVREVAGGGFRIGLARECGRELKPCRSCRADRWSHHDVANVSPVDRRYVSRMLKTLFFHTGPTSVCRDVLIPCGALLVGLFEYPAGCSPLIPGVQAIEVLLCRNSVSGVS